MSPKTFISNQYKGNDIVFEANAAKQCVIEMPFCIKMLSNICVIRTVSAKTCLEFLIYPGGGALGLFRTRFFAPGAVLLQLFLPWGGDYLPSQKNPQASAWGDVNNWK